MSFLHMLSSAVIMILLISLLILIHEAGHFFAAKAVGIRVDKFGFGLPVGPILFSKKIGETEVLVHACLLGGYVSFSDDEEDCDLPKDSPLRFANKTAGQRMIVIVAGVVCNLLLAYFLIFSTGLLWRHLPDNKYTVEFEGYADSASLQVKASGLQKGDIIYKINDMSVDYPVAINRFFTLSKEFDGKASQSIAEDKLKLLKELNPSADGIIKAGTVVNIPEFTDEAPVKLTFDNIVGLEKYNPDETRLSDTQMKLRDKINYQTKYKTQEDVTLEDIALAVSDTKKPISITVLRAGKEIPVNTLYSNKDGLVGIYQNFNECYTETKTLPELLKATNHYVNYNLGLMIYTLGKLFSGKVPMSEMNGILAITKIGTEIIAYKGIFEGILLSAIISLNLAIINILPIPALDGGHLLFLIIEKATGRPVSKKFADGLSNFFFYLLIALMILIVYNDIHAWITGRI